MKRIVYFFLMTAVLVLPTLAQALPCAKDMPVMERVAEDTPAKPCPYMKEVTKPCDSTMLVGECSGTDKALVVELAPSSLVKSDVPLVAVVDAMPYELIVRLSFVARAPPVVEKMSFSAPSLLLTTRRVRV